MSVFYFFIVRWSVSNRFVIYDLFGFLERAVIMRVSYRKIWGIVVVNFYIWEGEVKIGKDLFRIVG